MTPYEAGTDAIRDCLIGSSLMKVEHHEIVSYRGLILGAQQLGNAEVVALLQQNLAQEEQNAPKLLQQAAQAEA